MFRVAKHTDHLRRPVWVSFAIALPLALVIQFLTGGSERLAEAFSTILGAGPEPTVFERYAARLLAHIVAPALVLVVILRITRADSWLVLTRLSLSLLALTSALLVVIATRGLLLAAAGEPPFLYGTARTVFTGTMTSSLVAGLALVMGSTLWKRWLARTPWFSQWLSKLFQEV
jgi:hypothetical protein